MPITFCARTLLPAVRAPLGETMALELHSHCTIGLSPLTYLVVNFLKREEGVDYFDRRTNFNPFVSQ